ncbi:MAG: amino acid permease [Lewinellaceae bacterium]|nr:amino acid permease [Lewinellaceae bacterium]
MYLRLGWVVGNAGIAGAVLIVLIAHVISVTTGLSISSIATDKKIGAGGVYYVLSRSLGLPIGGAIGLTLFVGTALSISLYLVGFSESFNGYLGIPASANSLRITGSLALLSLTVIAFISTSIAIKTQYLILAAIAISLIAIFGGQSEFVPDHLTAFGTANSAPMETVFAIFFPAVTGFTAGIAMSGDLKDPKKSIPIGTIGAISVGFIIYLSLVIYVGLYVRPDILTSDNTIFMKIALYTPAVIAGIWGATLSSALGGILGGPRILQAMSVDQITPRIFGKGVGKDREPRNALLLTVLLAESGILIGELDLIARIVSIFYLAAYGFINIAFFLERWASTDFNPSFKVNKWVGLIGFAATFAVMFKLDMLAMFAAIAIISGVYIWLTKKEIALGTGDVWQSVWSSVVKSGLRRMVVSDDHKRNWKPNILLFSGSSDARPHLLEFSKALAGRTGLITNFDLIENEQAGLLFPKHKQMVQDDLLQQFDIFGRRIEVQNIFKGIETIATTFGFSGLDPNTVLMGWAKNTKDPIWFTQMTQRLIELDYNVLYLDYDKRWGFRKQEQIDLWFHQASNNPELMLHLAKFITSASEWRNARIRILVVNDFNVDRIIIESRIKKLLDTYRIQAEIRVINNQAEQKPFYEIMKILSADADLIFLGIPDINPGEEALFVRQTNDLVSVIGTTLLIKASSTFPAVPLGLMDIGGKPQLQDRLHADLIPMPETQDAALTAALQDLDDQWHELASSLSNNSLGVVQQHYAHFITSLREQALQLFNQLENSNPGPELVVQISTRAMNVMEQLSRQFAEDDLEVLRNVLHTGLQEYQKGRADVLKNLPATLRIQEATGPRAQKTGRKVKWRRTLFYHDQENGLSGLVIALREHSSIHAALLNSCKALMEETLRMLITVPPEQPNYPKLIKTARQNLADGFGTIQVQCSEIVKAPIDHIRNTDRIICRKSAGSAIHNSESTRKKNTMRRLTARQISQLQKEIERYPNTWQHHQVLFHRQFQVGLRLEAALLGIKKAIGDAMEQIRSNYFDGVRSNLSKLQAALPGIKKSAEAGKPVEPATVDLNAEEENRINADPVISQMINTIGLITDTLPNAVDLMDAVSRRTFPTFERGQAKEVVLAVDKVAAYLIETNLLEPFQQNLNGISNGIRQIRSDLMNSATKLSYGLNKAKNDKDMEALRSILQAVEAEAEDWSGKLTKTSLQFETEIRERTDATAASLEIGNIIDQAQELRQYAGRKNARGWSALRQNLHREFVRLRNQVIEYITKRRDDILLAGFEKRYQPLLGHHAALRNFMEAISMPPEVEQEVPLYYRHLFSGKHLSPGAKLDNRKREVAEAEKAIRYIRSGVSGAVMITGESLAGKTFFTDFVANRLIQGTTYFISAPPGGAVSESDLNKAFQSAIGRKPAIKNSLQAIPAGAIFIFNDIELWWLKAPNGSQVINKLVALINQFSHRHFFLLNCNLHALPLILNSTALGSALISTIVLPPVSQEALKKVIWARHQSGGMPLLYQGNLFTGVLATPPEKVFTRLFNLSNGNIGAAMRIWLASIRLSPGGALTLSYPASEEFPNLEDSGLNNFLVQLFLHKAISRTRLNKIYAFEGSDWVGKQISELQKSTILEPPEPMAREQVVSLRPEVRPYLERWLKERELL